MGPSRGDMDARWWSQCTSASALAVSLAAPTVRGSCRPPAPTLGSIFFILSVTSAMPGCADGTYAPAGVKIL